MPRVSIRLVLDEKAAIGPGKIALLRGIEGVGSIAQAAKALRMSYARAWSLIDELNRLFTDKLVETETGGRKGGGAQLTDLGRTVLALYDEINTDINGRHAGALAKLPRKPNGT
ncbi:winged helix-turn-helix domain-containing protein [Roseiterribacter gracilis]|uniref:LysR family transcriptional regulator n=1 Tax=Roseiterribacter gracilis TaxID=2812848 RepID=A0A8S8XJH9_9PROT|nr:LysR family transcriptional regulator [Rhodospirillales bacterium TMPK1]